MQTALPRRPFTTDEYHGLAAAGMLNEDDRVELLGGDIVEMTPIGSRHAACVDRLNLLLQRFADGRAIIRVQNPIRLNAYSEPQPDLSVLKLRTDFYATAHPAPADVLLVIEVSDSSAGYDLDVKLALYAQFGIPEVWLVDLQNGHVEIFTRPAAEGYQQSHRATGGDRVSVVALPGFDVSAGELVA